MGIASCCHKTHPASQLSVHSRQNEQMQQIVQEKSCLFCSYTKKIKRKLIWQNNFSKNLNLIDTSTDNDWIQQMRKQVNKKYQRSKFLKQINQLKLESNCIQTQENKQLLTREQFNEFKNNLHKSILFSDPFVKVNNKLQDAYHSQRIQIKKTMNNQSNQFDRGTYGTFGRKNEIKGSKMDIKQKSKLTEILKQSMLSFLDEKQQYKHINDNQLKKENAKTLQIFIKFTTMLENNFNNTTCALNALQRIFIKYIIKTYEKATLLYQKQQLIKKNQTIQHYLTSIIQSIRTYVKLMSKTVYDFYFLKQFTKQNCLNPLITSFDNLQAAITSILFKNVQFYLVLFEIVSLYNRSREDHLLRKIKQIGQITPERFGIETEYCLNYYTIKKAKFNQSLSVGSKIENFEFEKVINEQNNFKIPYFECVKTLQKMNKTKSPITKMKIITECSEQLTQSIYKFYKQNNLKLENEAVNADEVLSIYCYIIAKANVSSLLSHLYILENFATPYQEMSAAGYYWTVMMCAIQKIQEGVQQSIANHMAISY